MARIKLLQIGNENWMKSLRQDDEIEWYYCKIQDLPAYLEQLNAQRVQPKDKLQLEDVAQNDKTLTFTALLLTNEVAEAELEILDKMVEAHTVFQDSIIHLKPEGKTSFFQRKKLRPLPLEGSRQAKIDFLKLNFFSAQYGDKLKISEIDLHPQFSGRVRYLGHSQLVLSGDFGAVFTPLLSYRYNLIREETSIEIWQEFVKDAKVKLQLELIAYKVGSVGEIYETKCLTEADLATAYYIPWNPEVGYYSVSIAVKGQGELKLGALHWRRSRSGLGDLVLGGQRYADSQRQEFFSYFNPGDMKPPLNVYFSGYRPAEGFEGFGMMKNFNAPFLLISDPRIEGGSFYLGSEDYEQAIEATIQAALDELGFSHEELILSGLSMGTFGALYYAPTFNPAAVIVGKPFTNLGDTVKALKLQRPDEFETIADVLYQVQGATNQEAIAQLNQRFWDKFSQSDFSTTRFEIAYMLQDDYDNQAYQRLLAHFDENEAVQVVAKGYRGRHNDDTYSVLRWFINRYQKILAEKYGREF